MHTRIVCRYLINVSCIYHVFIFHQHVFWKKLSILAIAGLPWVLLPAFMWKLSLQYKICWFPCALSMDRLRMISNQPCSCWVWCKFVLGFNQEDIAHIFSKEILTTSFLGGSTGCISHFALLHQGCKEMGGLEIAFMQERASELSTGEDLAKILQTEAVILFWKQYKKYQLSERTTSCRAEVALTTSCDHCKISASMHEHICIYWWAYQQARPVTTVLKCTNQWLSNMPQTAKASQLRVSLSFTGKYVLSLHSLQSI